MTKDKRCSLLIGIVLASLVIALPAGTAIDLTADPLTNVMPISWDQAYSRIILSPDEAKLEKGEILTAVKRLDDGTIVAQSIGLIDAAPEECVRVARNYSHYTTIMPYTVESRIVRSFRVEGENPGAEAVDFWTRVCVLGFKTRYLIRMVHLDVPESHLYRSFWTLVRNPAAVPGCIDAEARPCVNDLDMNMGTSEFEPWKGSPGRTMHTYTLKIKVAGWAQTLGLRVGCGSSMRDVTKAIREAVKKKQ
jgi:hypothetical protein